MLHPENPFMAARPYCKIPRLLEWSPGYMFMLHYVGELLIGFLDLDFMPSQAMFHTTFRK